MLRIGGKSGEPPPEDGTEIQLWHTFYIHHKGSFSHVGGQVEYEGGIISVFDYVNLRGLSHETRDLLDGLAEQLGYVGEKKYYRVDSRGKLVQIEHGVEEIPPAQWSRSHFSTFSKCDLVLNNICESWNGVLVQARQKPIITMLEWIRMSLMKRLQQNRDRVERLWEGLLICPKIKQKLQRRRERACNCIPIKSNASLWEVECFDGTRVSVNLSDRSCSCRVWDLSGIPCMHAISAIGAQKLQVEEFVHECYRVETYNKVYECALVPMDGPEMWEKTGYIAPLPPGFGKKRGRPSKARRRGPDEEPCGRGRKKPTTTKKMPKQSWKKICKWCFELGHTERTCQRKKLIEEPTIEQAEERTQANDFPPFSQDSHSYPAETRIDDQSSQLVSTFPRSNAPLPSDVPPEPLQNSQQRVLLRIPPPMQLQRSEFIEATRVSTRQTGGVPIITSGGRKYVKLSNLQAAIGGTSTNKKSDQK